MPKKKKELPMPEIVQKKSKKILIAGTILAVGLILGVYGFISVKKEQPEYVQKNVVNNYVCKIVGADTEAEMIAVECLTK